MLKPIAALSALIATTAMTILAALTAATALLALAAPSLQATGPSPQPAIHSTATTTPRIMTTAMRPDRTATGIPFRGAVL